MKRFIFLNLYYGFDKYFTELSRMWAELGYGQLAGSCHNHSIFVIEQEARKKRMEENREEKIAELTENALQFRI